MLKEYTSTPQTVLACMIIDAGTVTKKKAGEYEYIAKGKGASTTKLLFATSPKQEPEVGDFIIYHSKDDIYLCKAEVFNVKYRPKGMVIL